MTQNEASEKVRSAGATMRLIGAVALAVVLIIFALLNLDHVDVNWIFGTWSTPLIVVVAVGLVVGALIDRLLVGHTRKRH